MRRLATTTWLVSISLRQPLSPTTAAFASDIVWEVAEPVPLLQEDAAFALHEKAFEAVRGKADSPLPGQHRLAHRAPAERSRLRRQVEPDALPRDRTQGFRALPPRLGRADARLGLLRAQLPSVPLSGGVRPAIFLGHREGGLRPPRRPHGRGDAFGRAPRRGRGGRVHLVAGSRAPAPARPRAASSPARRSSSSSACRIRRTPAASGVAVKVKLPDGRELAETTWWSRTC